MNIEQKIKYILLNLHNLPNKKRAIFYLQHEMYWFKWRKRKLKLGKIGYIFHQDRIGDWIYNERVSIKYVRQDTIDADENSFEAILDHFSWQWTTTHIWTFIILLFFGIKHLCKLAYWFYLSNFAYIFARSSFLDSLIRVGFKSLYEYNLIKSLDKWSYLNYSVIDSAADFCIFFDILF